MKIDFVSPEANVIAFGSEIVETSFPVGTLPEVPGGGGEDSWA